MFFVYNCVKSISECMCVVISCHTFQTYKWIFKGQSYLWLVWNCCLHASHVWTGFIVNWHHVTESKNCNLKSNTVDSFGISQCSRIPFCMLTLFYRHLFNRISWICCKSYFSNLMSGVWVAQLCPVSTVFIQLTSLKPGTAVSVWLTFKENDHRTNFL